MSNVVTEEKVQAWPTFVAPCVDRGETIIRENLAKKNGLTLTYYNALSGQQLKAGSGTSQHQLRAAASSLAAVARGGLGI